eukprot:CAMPEP_0116875260 /NCGR_PEP_ID=MMETSP0463-20121206/7122_1 /TAXON_ID=181622 /ORGANISM="Strombidinopsis sp, Strain SopsisLIS2011" /LENGTH=63 /DNA_ID=CAMNT_0004520527 /DNA_START=1119 /DNA_END=1310 /DNA_ORIENTATION=+
MGYHEVTDEEVKDLMDEMDQDENGAIDIDEFIGFFNLGDKIKMKHDRSKVTIFKVRKTYQRIC